MKINIESRHLAISMLINAFILIASLIYTLSQPNISLHFSIVCMTILIVLFIINVLLWAWLDNKESDTRHKAFFKDCELLEAKFKKLLIQRELNIQLANYYMNKYDKILDELLDYTRDTK